MGKMCVWPPVFRAVFSGGACGVIELRVLIQQRFQQGYNMRGNQGGQQGHNN